MMRVQEESEEAYMIGDLHECVKATCSDNQNNGNEYICSI